MKPEPQIEPLVYNCKQAAQALGISERTLWTLTRKGVVRCIRIGRSVKYDPADLRALLEDAKENSPQPQNGS
jgi:excisionase family DNA binding protein